jgi:hypothetical protein
MNRKRCARRQILRIIFGVVTLLPASQTWGREEAVLEKAKRKTIRMEAWKKDLLDQEKVIDPIQRLEQKAKDKETLKREGLKRLHEMALSYSAEFHNNKTDFEFNFCQDAFPVVNLLKTAHESGLRIDSLYCSLRILVNASKSCEYLRDCSLNAVLEALETYSVQYFVEEDKASSKKKTYREIEKTIYDFVGQSSDLTLASPGAFSAGLTSKVLKVSVDSLKPSQAKEWQERLGSLIFRFLEGSINKTLWDTEDWQGIWDSLLSSANSLYKLSKILVHMDHLDDILWSLTRRFVWFLDFSAGQLPVAFYENVEESIRDGSTFFLELGEQDSGIQTKKDLLLEAIAKNKARGLEPEFFAGGAQGKLSLASSAVKPTDDLVQPLESFFESREQKRGSLLAKSVRTKTSLKSSEAPKVQV